MVRGMVLGNLQSRNAFVCTYTWSRRNIRITYLNKFHRYTILREHCQLVLLGVHGARHGARHVESRNT